MPDTQREVIDTSDYELHTVELPVPPLHDAAAVDPARTVVLAVDLQNYSLNVSGPNYMGHEGTEAVRSTAALVEAARGHGVEVIWLKSVRDPSQPPFTVYGLKPYRVDGTWDAELVPPLEPKDGERVFKKYSHDVWNEPGFERYLEERGISGPEWSFIVAGASFAGCVHHAITGCSMRDYRVLVPMDCVAPRTGTGATVALYRLGHRSYSYNVLPLSSWESVLFDAAVQTDARGVPLEGQTAGSPAH